MGLFGPKKLKEEDYYFTLEFNFAGKAQEDYAPESFTYGHLYMPTVHLMAREWFGEDPITIRQAFKDVKEIDPDSLWGPLPEGEVDFIGEPSVDRSLIESYKTFDGCEMISWGESAIAKKWQATLESKGVKLHVMGSPQDPEKEIITGTWVLFDDYAILPIIGEAWRNKKTGKEFVYWFIDAVARSRKTNVEPREYPSHLYFYPELFQRIGYISETVFPSSMVRIRNRAMEFGLEADGMPPKVALHVVKDYYVLGLSNGEKDLVMRFDWAPEVTRYGYIIDDSVPFESVEEIVIQLVNALPKVASILCDGFANWCFHEEFSFQDALFTDLYFANTPSEEIYRVGINIPGPAYGALAWKSVMSYALLDQLERDPKLMQSHDSVLFHRGGLFRISNQGIGPATSHATNSLYFRVAQQDDVTQIEMGARKKIEDLLNYYSQFPFDRQDANALSNLSMLQSAWGKYKEALESAEKGIALFKSDLQQKHVTEMSGGGPFYPIIIKWELYLTKARVLVLLEQHEKAKEPLTTMIREARALQYEGEELSVAEKLLASL